MCLFAWVYNLDTLCGTSCVGTALECVVQGNIEGRIEVAGGRKRRREQLQDNLKETRGYRELKEEEALDRTLLRTGFGRKLWTCRDILDAAKLNFISGSSFC
jgi:hypothetical protein